MQEVSMEWKEDSRAVDLQRHQLVYGALGERMGGEIHALSLATLTPEELAAKSH